MTLDAKSCVPCKGGVEPLGIDEACELLKQVPDWKLVEGSRKLFREFTFRNYKQALAFVNGISVIAEQEQHHPDITFSWGFVKIAIQTHAISGLQENDFILAAKIDQYAKAK